MDANGESDSFWEHSQYLNQGHVIKKNLSQLWQEENEPDEPRYWPTTFIKAYLSTGNLAMVIKW